MAKPNEHGGWDLTNEDAKEILNTSLRKPRDEHDQPLPTPNRMPFVHDLVADDVEERGNVGRARYGTRLQPRNGRSHLLDTYQELLDASVYIRAELWEREHLPEIVTLCGSTRFRAAFDIERRRLTMDGVIVLGPEIYGHVESAQVTDDEKSKLDELHMRKIDVCDRIHVINIDQYIGESTQREIQYAMSIGREVSYYQPPAEQREKLTPNEE